MRQDGGIKTLVLHLPRSPRINVRTCSIRIHKERPNQRQQKPNESGCPRFRNGWVKWNKSERRRHRNAIAEIITKHISSGGHVAVLAAHTGRMGEMRSKLKDEPVASSGGILPTFGERPHAYGHAKAEYSDSKEERDKATEGAQCVVDNAKLTGWADRLRDAA